MYISGQPEVNPRVLECFETEVRRVGVVFFGGRRAQKHPEEITMPPYTHEMSLFLPSRLLPAPQHRRSWGRRANTGGGGRPNTGGGATAAL